MEPSRTAVFCSVLVTEGLHDLAIFNRIPLSRCTRPLFKMIPFKISPSPVQGSIFLGGAITGLARSIPIDDYYALLSLLNLNNTARRLLLFFVST